MTDLLSCVEVAKIKRVSRRAVQFAIQTGRLPGVRIGNALVIRREDAQRWTPCGPGRQKVKR